jgi:endonuclease/exonuclease/phosphatase family metal-dependent hydrolase
MRIAVVTWNVHAGAGDLFAFDAALRRGQLTGGRPQPAFILLLQEAYRDTADRDADGRLRIVDVARTLGLALAYVPSMHSGHGPGADRGNAVLASIGLDQVTFVELPFERQRRVTVIATVKGQSTSGTPWRLGVASVHLDTGWMIVRGGGASARHRQESALASILRGSPAPVIVGGDFNTSWEGGEPAVQALGRLLPDAQPFEGSTWKGPLGLRRRLDYLFARLPDGRLNVTRAAGRFGSDHYPLIAVVGIDQLIDSSDVRAGTSHGP